MAQLNFTLDFDAFIGLFLESKDEAFSKLLETILNQALLTGSSEQPVPIAESYEFFEECQKEPLFLLFWHLTEKSACLKSSMKYQFERFMLRLMERKLT